MRLPLTRVRKRENRQGLQPGGPTAAKRPARTRRALDRPKKQKPDRFADHGGVIEAEIPYF